MRYKVLVTNISGRKNRIYNSGDIVTEKDINNSNISHLIKNKFIEPYKESIHSQDIEFGYELVSVLPFAYHLYTKNLLEQTTSSFDTSYFYYFSPKHIESSGKRSFENTKKINYPNIRIHTKSLDLSQFTPPPLKKIYSSFRLDLDKPLLCICNRVTSEWLGEPVNFFDNDCLDWLFAMLKDKYKIIYFNIKGKKEYYDDQIPIETGEEAVINKHGITTIHDLMDQARQYNFNSFNLVQLIVMSNCNKFITMNGGYCFLAGYMGGTNIIYSKKCREIEPGINSFYRWYHKLGESRAVHVPTYEDLFKKVKSIYLDEQPVINILIRTSGRPNYFNQCISSIYSQTYQNYNIIVGCDDDQSMEYVQPHRCKVVRYEQSKEYFEKKHNSEYGYGRIARYNLYMNDLHKEVKEGFILYLDDDNVLFNENSLSEIAKNIKSEDDLLLFRIQFPEGRTIPSDENFKKPPVLCDFDTAGFCFHHKYAVDWEPYKMGDWRVGTKLWGVIPNKIFINKKLTKINRKTANGFGRRDDL